MRQQPRQQQNVWQQQQNIQQNTAAWNQPRARLDRDQQQRIQQERLSQYNQRWSNWQNLQTQRDRYLQQQRRSNYLRYQQQYWNQIRLDQQRLQQARYYNNYYNNYRYNRGGQYYYTSEYGAQSLRQAINNGYQQGFYAGQADRQDNWNFDPTNSFAYQDGAYGYDSWYVSSDEYSYYFRQGFERGYQDGFYGRYQYGNYSGGKYSILGSVISTILNIASF